MTLEVLETDARDGFDDHWAPLFAVEAANLLVLALMVLFWPLLAVIDLASGRKLRAA